MDYARFLVADLPSKDSVLGVVVFKDGNASMLLCNARLQSDYGLLGIKRALQEDKSNKVKMSEEILEHPELDKAVQELANKLRFDTRISMPIEV